MAIKLSDLMLCILFWVLFIRFHLLNDLFILFDFLNHVFDFTLKSTKLELSSKNFISSFEQRHEKTGFFHMRKQRRRSAVR